MDAATRETVRRRANDCCEYCRLPQQATELRHHLEHIVAKKHGGSDSTENLALACHRCNLHKGANLAGVDPLTGTIAQLFHPRHDEWSTHFRWDGVRVKGITSSGRATVRVLQINDARRMELRAELSPR